jgi:hypothetical protein
MRRQNTVARSTLQRLILVAGTVSFLGLCCCFRWSSVAAQERSDGPADTSTSRAAVEWLGISSCTAVACHGSTSGRAAKGGEYTTWLSYDKHGQAYEALLSPRSAIIEKNFRHLADVKSAHAETDAVCLSCHAVDAQHPKSEVNLEGVSCEACHGPAKGWLRAHYMVGFKELSPAEKEKTFGMRPMTDLLYRARVCADCHVGRPGREINHDLYGAGHPPLNYEFGAYQAIMPKHWDVRQDRERNPGFEAKSWAIGQVVSGRAAMDLLRVHAAANSPRWPEFADYSCYACHQDLQFQSRRQNRQHYAGRVPGALPMSTWFTTLLPEAAGKRANAEEVSAINTKVGAFKQVLAMPLPDRGVIAEQAASLASILERIEGRLAEGHYTIADVQAMLASIQKRATATGNDPMDWDQQTQIYLGMAAACNALNDLDKNYPLGGLLKELEQRRMQLQFPKGYDSPHGFDSPRGTMNKGR